MEGGSLNNVAVEGQGRKALVSAAGPLDCGNSGTTMRLLAGLLASAPFESTLTGDQSLRTRPMERIAEPLRRMGAGVQTAEGHAPVRIIGARLTGIDVTLAVPSAQVKGAILLAAVAADGETIVREPAATRDHTERALQALGAPVSAVERAVSVSAFQHGGFEASVPGDVSSAAFLVAAAAVTGGDLTIHRVGLNETRTHFLRVLERMGVRTAQHPTGRELGEPVGDLEIHSAGGLVATTVEPWELPLVIDEVPILAALAAHAAGETWFRGGAELRVKESDRLGGLARALRRLGGGSAVQGDDLIVAGGGLTGGRADAVGDHRMAMALAVAALGASGECEIRGMESAEVSFPGFVETLAALGGRIEG
jgi:3-phosphoshikimate 1-carboxyvinyltransferase